MTSETLRLLLGLVLVLQTSSPALGEQVHGGNPFESGCLFEKLDRWSKKRVCNSADPEDAQQLGLCRVSEIQYEEVRIFSQNWESSIFESWLLQIILSELLDVPVTLETGTPDAKLDFFDSENRFELGSADYFTALDNAVKLNLNCQGARQGDEDDFYESCAHFVPEVWENRLPWVTEWIYEGIVEQEPMGIFGYSGWFIPKFTATRDPTLVSHFGLEGEENRRKLADRFLRPTTWRYYCEKVSPNNCQTPDFTSKRAPIDESEYDRMFVEGLYTGHFRKTEQNDCIANPQNCSGSFGDYPCGWTSYAEAQMYHNNIALSSDGDEPGSGGYTYTQLRDMWLAANATKSDIIMLWWHPEAMYQAFEGTEAEFVQVAMPRPTQECLDNRVTQEERCAADQKTRVGTEVGSCAESGMTLQKLMLRGLYDREYDSDIPEAARSPAHEVLQNFYLTELQLGEIFNNWHSMSSPREAVCQWAADNIGYMNAFVPRTYPRTIQESDTPWIMYVTTSLAVLTAVLVIITGFVTYAKRGKRAVRNAQIEFLLMLLAGAFLVTIGAMVLGLPPSNGTCVAAIWLINIGYTLVLVPLVVKVAAINRLMVASRQMRRVRLTRKTLYGAVACISTVNVVFLAAWTTLDAPSKDIRYHLTDSKTDEEFTIIDSYYHCRSDSETWQFAAAGWNALLLLCASVLAFQTRGLRQEYNESRTLAFLVYSHFVFVVARLVSFAVPDSANAIASMDDVRSLLFSIDTIAMLAIYFVPKLFATEDTRASSFVDGSTQNFNTSSLGIGALFNRVISSMTMISHHELEEGQTVGAVRFAIDDSRKQKNASHTDGESAEESFCEHALQRCGECGQEIIEKEKLLIKERIRQQDLSNKSFSDSEKGA